MKRIKTAIMILSAMSCALVARAANVPVPFTDDFEVEIDTNWIFDDELGVQTNTHKIGAKSLYSEESAKLPIATGNPQVWFNCYTIMTPVPSNEVPDIAANAAAFYLDDARRLMAYSSNAFIEVEGSVETNGWHGFSVQLDFANDTWNIYHKAPGATTNDPLTRLNPLPLYFSTNYTGTEITMIEVAGPTFLDEVMVTSSAVPVTPEEEQPTYAATVPLILDGDASGVNLKYIGINGNMDSELGFALEDLFSVGDQLLFWNGAGFTIVQLEATGWDKPFEITPTTGFFIKRVGATQPRTGVISYSAPFTHVGTPATAIQNGWNLLTVPHTAGARMLSTVGFPAVLNDQVFLRTATSYSTARFNGSVWTPNIQLPAGRTFWYLRRGGATSWPTLN